MIRLHYSSIVVEIIESMSKESMDDNRSIDTFSLFYSSNLFLILLFVSYARLFNE